MKALRSLLAPAFIVVDNFGQADSGINKLLVYRVSIPFFTGGFRTFRHSNLLFIALVQAFPGDQIIAGAVVWSCGIKAKLIDETVCKSLAHLVFAVVDKDHGGI